MGRCAQRAALHANSSGEVGNSRSATACRRNCLVRLLLTGMGHGTDRAVLLGLSGNEPATIDPAVIDATVAEIRATKTLNLAGKRRIEFDER